MSRVDDWVKKKNSNPGPPILEQAKTWMRNKGYNGLYEEIPHLDGYHLPEVPEDIIAVVIPSVLSKEECQGIIEVIPSDGQGYMSPEDIRKLYRDRVVHRYITRDTLLSSLIHERLRPFIPETLDGGDFVCVSPSWRFLRYEVGGHQAAHLDGRENSPDPHETYSLVQSRLTIQMYLNDHFHHNNAEGYKGGEMVFYNSDGETVRHTHYPRAGDCLLFFQESMKYNDFQLIHEAMPVEEGTKYAMRTIVDYGWRL